MLLCRALGGAQGFVYRIGFGGAGQIEHALRQRDLAFGAAEKIEYILGRQRLLHGLRIGQADILHRRAHQAAGDEQRLLAAGQHARQPVERRVGVAAADGLMQRGDDVVMLLAALVVERHPALYGRHQPGRVQRLDRLHAGQFFHQIQKIAAIAIGHGAQGRAGIFGQLHGFAEMGFGALQQFFQRRVIQPAEHQHLGAAQQRAVQLEAGVLGGGAHQHHGAVFHNRQETVLLAAVEAVDLVNEQKRALPHAATLACGLEGLLQVGDTAEHGRELVEVQMKGVRKQPRGGGLAGAGRSPQDDGGRPAIDHHAAQGTFRPKQVVLAHHFSQGLGAQAVGKRTRGVAGQAAGFEQIGHGFL